MRLHANLCKYEKARSDEEEVGKNLTKLRTEMAKSACEMQHNNVVLEETLETLGERKSRLENLHKDLMLEEQEYEMLQALLYTQKRQEHEQARRISTKKYAYCQSQHTKELLDTLV